MRIKLIVTVVARAGNSEDHNRARCVCPTVDACCALVCAWCGLLRRGIFAKNKAEEAEAGENSVVHAKSKIVGRVDVRSTLASSPARNTCGECDGLKSAKASRCSMRVPHEHIYTSSQV
jgi:hypothetical protein